jgi:hypothetical protein
MEGSAMYYRNKIADGGQEKRLPQCKQRLVKPYCKKLIIRRKKNGGTQFLALLRDLRGYCFSLFLVILSEAKNLIR